MRPEEAASWGELARRMCTHAWGVRRDRAFADGAYSRDSGPGFSLERPQRAPLFAGSDVAGAALHGFQGKL